MLRYVIESDEETVEEHVEDRDLLDVVPPTTRSKRKRHLPSYLQESQVEPLYKEAASVKVRVKCSQTGEVFSMNLDELTKEDGEDVDYTAVHGDEVIYTDCRNGKSYVKIWGKAEGTKKGKPPKVTKVNSTPARKNSAALATQGRNTLGEDDTQNILDEATSLVDSASKHTPNRYTYTRDNIHLNELLVSMDKKLDKILEKFSSGLDATTTCRSSSKTINKDDPKFVKDGIFLLKIEAKDPYAYGRSLLDALFTKPEQREGILFPSKKSTKTALDPARVELLFDCIRINHPNYDHTKLVSSLNQKCRDVK